MKTYTAADVEAATTGQLRTMFTAITRKSTVDRNKGKLKARVMKLVQAQLASAPPVDRVEAKRGGSGEQITGMGKPSTPLQQTIDRANRRDEIAGRAAVQKKPGRVEGLSEALKKGPVTFTTKGHPLDRARPAKTGLAGMKAQKGAQRKPAAKKVKATAKPKVAKTKKPAATKKTKTPRSESETRVKLAALKAGQTLKHVFRQGNGESLTVECKVISPPDLEGKGGKFKYDGRTFDDLREVIKACSNTNYNVLLFWGLKEWPKHKNRGPAAEAAA